MANAKRDQNHVPTLIGVSSVDMVTPVLVAVDPVTGRVLTDSASAAVTVYNDTVSGTINGSNVTFTVTHTIAANGAIILVLANSSYQAGVDYTYSGTTITMTVAPDASLSGQPFWMAHT